MQPKRYSSFAEFYPFYLSQHQDPVCRRLHYIGSSIILVIVVNTLINQHWWQLLWLPVVGYGFAWLGHFMFEKNRPATFTYPLYSLWGDWVMFGQMLMRLLFLTIQNQLLITFYAFLNVNYLFVKCCVSFHGVLCG
jgi:hypothetical protein